MDVWIDGWMIYPSLIYGDISHSRAVSDAKIVFFTTGIDHYLAEQKLRALRKCPAAGWLQTVCLAT